MHVFWATLQSNYDADPTNLKSHPQAMSSLGKQCIASSSYLPMLLASTVVVVLATRPLAGLLHRHLDASLSEGCDADATRPF